MSEYQRYPMLMTHPHAQKGKATAIPHKDPNTGRQVTDWQGTPDKFPPVTVHNSKQEEYHASLGYQPAGSPNAAAYTQVVEGVVEPGYEPEEYPKWVGEVLVKNEMEEAALKSVTLDEYVEKILAPASDKLAEKIKAEKKAAKSAKMKAAWAAKKAKKAAEAASA